jgi:AcrR family transcriptional regulator
MSQSKTTKEKIIDSAIKIFSSKGFVKTKVSDIVADASFSQGTFYNYFKSKDECFIELLTSLHQGTIEQMNQIITTDHNNIIYELTEKFISRVLEHRPIVKIFLHEGLTTSKEIYNLHYQFKENILDIYRQAINHQNLKIENLEIKLLILSGAIREIMDTLVIKENYPDKTIIKYAKKTIDILFGEHL